MTTKSELEKFKLSYENREEYPELMRAVRERMKKRDNAKKLAMKNRDKKRTLAMRSAGKGIKRT